MSAVNTIGLCISFIFLISLARISASQNRQLIPPGFNQICVVDNPLKMNEPSKIKCDISRKDTQKWRLDSLRDWMTTSGNNQSNRFSYHITCGKTGGSVSVPWPMLCPQLVELTVTNCNITDTFADFGKDLVNSIPQSLTRLEIVDSSMVMKHSNLLNMFSQVENITSAYDCLHDKTIEKLTFRNVSYILVNDMEKEMECCILKQFQDQLPDLPELPTLPSLSNDTGNSSVGDVMPDVCDDRICDILDIENIINLPKRLRLVEISCNFVKLRELDESVSSTLSVYHHRFLTKYSKFPVLEYLNYSYNNIDVIPEELRDWSFYFNVINHMDLSNNFIRKLTFKSAFVNKLVNDTYINVQYNNITTLSLEDLSFLKQQQKSFIDIRNNPLHCDCDMKDFIVKLSNPNTFTGAFKKYEYIRDMTCHEPNDLQGRTLKSLTTDDLVCDEDPWVVPFVILTIVAVLLLTILLLAFIYRREIRILFYTRFNIQIPGAVYVGLGPKTYHAFVSYSNEDEDWVIDVLCKHLEEPSSNQCLETSSKNRKSKTMKQFKLCLHARDFIPGMTIIENIINSIEKSSHTIIILTQNFIHSRWAMEEFYQAYQQSVLERRRHLIIVICGELPDDKMDPVLKRCLKTFTYLKTSDKLFYDRLAYSLSTENKMTKEESSKEEEILKSRKNTSSIDMSHESDSGIYIAGDEPMSSLSGQLSSQMSVISNTNSELGLIAATHL